MSQPLYSRSDQVRTTSYNASLPHIILVLFTTQIEFGVALLQLSVFVIPELVRWSDSIPIASYLAKAHQYFVPSFVFQKIECNEKNIIRRISDIQQLPQDDKAHLFALMDAFLRDYKAKKAYAS